MKLMGPVEIASKPVRATSKPILIISKTLVLVGDSVSGAVGSKESYEGIPIVV